MSNQSLRVLSIKTISADAYGLRSVVDNPRNATPQDVLAACQNTAVLFQGKKPARDVVSLVNYVINGYFQYAHKTGLYNRQKEMWDAIARIDHCKVDIVRQGVLLPIKLPVLDVTFYNTQKVPIILTRLVKPQKRRDFDKRCERYLSSFIQKVGKMHSRNGTLTGAMIFMPSPVGANVIAKVQNKVGANDPANRFDSRLPQPVDIPFDVIAMDYDETIGGETGAENPTTVSPGDGTESLRLIYPEDKLYVATMVHPNLSAKK
jgi:hypothetical protein